MLFIRRTNFCNKHSKPTFCFCSVPSLCKQFDRNLFCFRFSDSYYRNNDVISLSFGCGFGPYCRFWSTQYSTIRYTGNVLPCKLGRRAATVYTAIKCIYSLWFKKPRHQVSMQFVTFLKVASFFWLFLL